VEVLFSKWRVTRTRGLIACGVFLGYDSGLPQRFLRSQAPAIENDRSSTGQSALMQVVDALP